MDHPQEKQFCPMRALVIIALGANEPGPWGTPLDTLRAAVTELANYGLKLVRHSAIYDTVPVGMPRQPNVLNAVIAARTSMGPAAVLRALKAIERRAGRSSVRMSRSRTLDLDIIAYGGRTIGWRHRRSSPLARRAGQIVLPHPFAHRRAFVLVPLAEVSPNWYHPVFGLTAKQLVRRLPNALRKLPASPVGLLANRQLSCENETNKETA